jgi:hypothetical protein
MYVASDLLTEPPDLMINVMQTSKYVHSTTNQKYIKLYIKC